MISWEKAVEKEVNGLIPLNVYYQVEDVQRMVCLPDSHDVATEKAKLWDWYMKAGYFKNGDFIPYYTEMMWRYKKWYGGFWQQIVKSVKQVNLGPSPILADLSAGTGMGTNLLLNSKNWSPKLIVTEFNDFNLSILQKQFQKKNQTVIKWDANFRLPLINNLLDLAIFALNINYYNTENQHLIIAELMRCIKSGGYLVLSTLTPDFSFAKALKNKIRIIRDNPLMIRRPSFTLWQIKWAAWAEKIIQMGGFQYSLAQTFVQQIASQINNYQILEPLYDRIPVQVLILQKK